MKHTVRTLLAVLLLGTASGIACAYTASALVDASTYAELRKTGQLQHIYYRQNNVKLSLMPASPQAQKSPQYWKGNAAPVFVAEELFLKSKAELASNGDASSVTIDRAAKVIRSVSKMQGMTYLSRDKKVEVLYKDAYCIKGAKDRTRVEDDVSGSADGKVMYCMLNDHSFGKTNYRLEYHQSADEVGAAFVSTSPLSVGVIKAIDAGNLMITLSITDCGDDLLVYMLVEAKFPALAMLEDMMTESFTSRLDAIYKWFTEQF